MDNEKMQFISTKLDFSSSMKFIDREVSHLLKNILEKQNMYPVTLGNMLEAYKFLYTGCLQNNINLNV